MIICGVPAGLLLGLIGLLFDTNKRPAITALILGGGMVGLFALFAAL